MQFAQRSRQRWGKAELLQDGLIPVGKQALPRRFGVFAVGIRANLNVLQLVLRFAPRKCGIALHLESVDQQVCIFMMGEGRHLHYEAACGRRQGRGRGSCG